MKLKYFICFAIAALIVTVSMSYSQTKVVKNDYPEKITVLDMDGKKVLAERVTRYKAVLADNGGHFVIAIERNVGWQYVYDGTDAATFHAYRTMLMDETPMYWSVSANALYCPNERIGQTE